MISDPCHNVVVLFYHIFVMTFVQVSKLKILL